MSLYAGILALLLSPLTPLAIVTVLQASNMPAIVVSRVSKRPGQARQGRGLEQLGKLRPRDSSKV